MYGLRMFSTFLCLILSTEAQTTAEARFYTELAYAHQVSSQYSALVLPTP